MPALCSPSFCPLPWVAGPPLFGALPGAPGAPCTCSGSPVPGSQCRRWGGASSARMRPSSLAFPPGSSKDGLGLRLCLKGTLSLPSLTRSPPSDCPPRGGTLFHTNPHHLGSASHATRKEARVLSHKALGLGSGHAGSDLATVTSSSLSSSILFPLFPLPTSNHSFVLYIYETVSGLLYSFVLFLIFYM